MSFLEQFAIGPLTFLFSAAFVVLYLAARQMRRFVAYANNTDGPQERVWVYVVFLAALGLIAGGLAQGAYDDLSPCISAGYSIVECTFQM